MNARESIHLVEDPDVMAKVMLRYREGQASGDELANHCYAMVRRAAHAAAFKAGVDFDDATQELWLLFSTRIVERFDPSFGSPMQYVMGYARLQALGMRGNQREISFTDMNPVGTGNEDQVDGEHWVIAKAATDTEFTDIDTDKIDRERALAKIAQCVYDQQSQHSNVTQDTDMEVLLPVVEEVITQKKPVLEPLRRDDGGTSGDKRYVRSEDQEELRSMRKRLGMTKMQFANLLGINQARLDSYEYGKTQGVNAKVMENARKIAENQGDPMKLTRAKFDGKPLSEILAGWVEVLGLGSDEESTKFLAELINTSPTTIRRWREEKVRPDVEKLAKIDAKISRGRQYAARATAQEHIDELVAECGTTGKKVLIHEGLAKAAYQAFANLQDPSEKLLGAISYFKGGLKVASSDSAGTYYVMDTDRFQEALATISKELAL